MTRDAEPETVAEKRALLSVARVSGALALLLFAVLALLVRGPAPTELDVAITRALQSVAWLRGPMTIVSIPGDGLIPHALTTTTVIALVAVGRRLDGAFLAISAGLGAALNSTIKHLVARPRPTAEHVLKLDLVDGFSFPSGHVAFYVCYFGFLAVVASRGARAPRMRRIITACALVPIGLVPISRIYLGAHWASDTVGALLWSTTWVGVVAAMYDAVRQRREAKAGVA